MREALHRQTLPRTTCCTPSSSVTLGMLRPATALVALAGLATLASSNSAHPSDSVHPTSHAHARHAHQNAHRVEERSEKNWFGRRADVPIPDPASVVDLFIGTTSSGHAFPGA